MVKNINTSNKRFILLFFTNLSIYFNYLVFLIFFLIFTVLGVSNERKFKKIEVYLIKIIPLNYYFFNLFNTFNTNPQSSIFWDMQNFLHYLKCNTSDTDYNYRFLGDVLNCPNTIGYGPLTELIKFDSLDIWNVTLITAILFFTFSMSFIFFAKEDFLIKTSILISPGFHFLIFSLNTDIYVVLLILFLINKKLQLNLTVKLTVLTFISLIKSYTAILFIGLILKSIVYKNYKKALIEFLFLALNVILLINHYFLKSSFLPEPISFTRTFGLLHDFKLITTYIGYDEASILFILFIILIFIFKNKFVTTINSLNFSDIDLVNKLVVVLPVSLFINLYQNWGYKFVFNSIVIFYFYKISDNKSFKFFLILVNLMSITYFSIGWGYEESVLNLIIIAISKLSFYSFLTLSVIIFYKLLKNLKLVIYSNPADRNTLDTNI